MSELITSRSVNPRTEGEYRVYGFAILSPDGGYCPAYRIERVRGISDAPKEAVALHQVRGRAFATEGLAKMMAVSHGVERVRAMDRLSC